MTSTIMSIMTIKDMTMTIISPPPPIHNHQTMLFSRSYIRKRVKKPIPNGRKLGTSPLKGGRTIKNIFILAWLYIPDLLK